MEKYSKQQVPLNWTQDYGYHNPKTDSFPFHCMGGLYAETFQVYLRQLKKNFEKVCDLDMGFKLLMHTSSDTPLYKLNFLKLPLAKDAHISVVPRVTITSPSLNHYSPIKYEIILLIPKLHYKMYFYFFFRRHCYFPGERYLRYFKVYSENNCFSECLANSTQAMCGCVLFYMPSKRKSKFPYQKLYMHTTIITRA